MAFSACTCELVSLCGVRFRCVGLAQKISARRKRTRNTGSYVFSLFFICIFIFLPALSYMHVFFLFPQRVPIDLEVGGGKSILTRTKTLPTSNCFKEPLLFITLCLMRMCFHLLFIAIRT